MMHIGPAMPRSLFTHTLILLLVATACTGLSIQGHSTVQGTSLSCTCSSSLLEVADCPQGYYRHHHAVSAAAPAHTVFASCCLPNSCLTESKSASKQHRPLRLPGTTAVPPVLQPAGATPPGQHNPRKAPKQHQAAAKNDESQPQSDWMTQCCSDMLLRQMFLPGTHDSGTYMWTTPKHMPMVLDEILSILFNIVGDLSRTQRLDVYQQLQAGARVLDIRLAINPWLAVQARAQQATTTKSSTSSATHVPTSHAAASRRLSRNSSWRALLQQQHVYEEPGIVSRQAPDGAASTGFFQKLSALIAAAALTMSSAMFRAAASAAVVSHRTSPAAPNGSLLQLDPVLLEAAVDMQSAGGPLTAAERQGCIVTSHSLPAAPLSTVLGDVRRFLAENPGELVVLLVKADTVDVNVAGSLRFTPEDWAAAAAVFQRELQGVQLVDELQVQQLTLGQLAAGSRGGGSVLLYSSELQQQGLVAVNTRRTRILESWFNGTNTEDLGQLKVRLINWLQFWRSVNWRQIRKPFLLLASAEVTLGVKTILAMVKNRIWRWQAAMLSQSKLSAAERLQLQRVLAQWQQLQQGAGLTQDLQEQLSPPPQQQYWSAGSASKLASGMTTLYQLGIETNQQMLQDVLGNHQVPRDFNVWSLDAISPDIANYIINLNSAVKPTRQQQPTRQQ